MDRGRIESLGRIENQIFLVGVAVFLVCALWRSSVLLAVLLVGLAVAVGPRSGAAFLRCFGFGAGVGLVAESFAVHAGAWRYAAPDAFGLPIWLPILWGLVAVGPAAALARDELVGVPRPGRDRLWIEAVLMATTVAGIVLLWRHNAVLSVVPLVACGVILAVRRRWTLVTICVGAIIVGFIAETLAVDRGAWTYAAPNFGPLPVWVGPMWGACVLVMTQFARRLLLEEQDVRVMSVAT